MFSGSSICSVRSGSWTGGEGVWVELFGKMHVLARFLSQLCQRTNDRIVLVSNYTDTGPFFSIVSERRYLFLRLDGTTSISKRQKLVNRFNDPSKPLIQAPMVASPFLVVLSKTVSYLWTINSIDPLRSLLPGTFMGWNGNFDIFIEVSHDDTFSLQD
ncbi:hypothetical protein ACSBR2_001261 [Camellia fascicularis]